jgi:[glutamine synthetase] adenylyltransferase / [glutamine synthetase]-adenylyl-L-tyrosine phosphorylase
VVRAILSQTGGDLGERLVADEALAQVYVAVVAASDELARLLRTDPGAVDVLDHLDARVPPADGAHGAAGAGSAAAAAGGADGLDVDELVRWQRREYLRIAARDVTGLDPLESTTAALADLAADVLRAAVALVGAEDLAVVGMGKLGGRELNYASDVDVLFVGGDVRQARAVMDVARRCYRVDANLRPEGRDGPLTRSLDSYVAYWQRWAQPWEFQALIKAVPVAGDPGLAEAWAERAAEVLWSRIFGVDDIRSLRALKARAEEAALRRDGSEWEVKRSPGGIRDIEFSVQLLQLVHGRVDPELRSPTTLVALGEMAAAGYVDPTDADGLADAYRFFRRAEHALQLDEGRQTHTLPTDRDDRRRVARVLGYRATLDTGATAALDADLARHRNLVRSIHERLYFRPLMDALAGAGPLSPEAAERGLSTFGFADAARTREAMRELTRGLTRSSRMMQQLLPLLLDWLSTTPDPDMGLLGLRKMASGTQRTMELAGAFRDSPEVARHLCVLLGTSRLFADTLAANPDLIVRLADPTRLRTQAAADLASSTRRALGWRSLVGERQRALHRWLDRHRFGVAARDLFGDAPVDQVGEDLTALADACVGAALGSLEPAVPFAVVALGRFAGRELAYGSDLDVVFVYDGKGQADHDEALRVAGGLRRFLGGDTPAHRIFPIDPDLRPEGRQGPLARSLAGYAAYFARWAQTWERQAMARARPVAGDGELGERFAAVVDEAVWGRPFTPDDEREVRRMKARVERERIPPGEDPEFHLKLGRGSLSDVEWTVQLLQLRHGLRQPGTLAALAALVDAGVVSAGDADVLRAAYRFCAHTRNRWWLVGAAPRSPDALPQRSDDAVRLARSLGTVVPNDLRDDYRRVTRRARRVVERLFYNGPGTRT